MSLIKQRSSELIVIGVEGNTHEQTLWKNFIHNYSATKGKFYSVSNHFGYFMAETSRLENSLALYFSHRVFVAKKINAEECDILQEKYLQEARDFIESLPNETFYSHLISPAETYSENSISLKSNNFSKKRTTLHEIFTNLELTPIDQVPS